MDKYLCERCGKELVFRCAYSRIDHKLICVECDDKEQPKELMKKIDDLEAKLTESENTIRLLKMSNDALREDNLDLSYNQVDNVYETATEMSKGWEEQYQEEIAQLKQQLAEKDAEVQKWKDGTMVVKLGKLEEKIAEKEQAIESLQEINQSLGQTCNNDAKEIERLNKLVAEKKKECVIWERAYEYAIFECDFYKNHTQTPTEETMKRIEQLYEKILKRVKLLMEDK